MRALIDTNILLDLILDRLPFANEAGRFEGYIAAISPINVFYIVRKTQGPDKARQVVRDILTAFEVCALDSASLHAALTLPLKDYEDATQLASAIAYGLDALVTRDPTDFMGAPMAIFSPAAFLSQVPQ